MNAASPPAVTVLGRAPEPGRVKTRLAASLGAVPAAEVHEALALDLLDRLAEWRSRRGGAPADLVLALTGGAAAAARLAEAARTRMPLRVEEQGEGDLGARIEEALARRGAEAGRVGGAARGEASLVVGTDAVLLGDEILDAAAEALRFGGRAVLAPSTDGGFVLLGAGRLRKDLLQGLPWGGPQAMEATRRRLEEGGWEVALVPGSEDVDEIDDLRRLAAVLAEAPARAPRTALWLEKNRDAWGAGAIR